MTIVISLIPSIRNTFNTRWNRIFMFLIQKTKRTFLSEPFVLNSVEEYIRARETHIIYIIYKWMLFTSHFNSLRIIKKSIEDCQCAFKCCQYLIYFQSTSNYIPSFKSVYDIIINHRVKHLLLKNREMELCMTLCRIYSIRILSWFLSIMYLQHTVEVVEHMTAF